MIFQIDKSSVLVIFLLITFSLSICHAKRLDVSKSGANLLIDSKEETHCCSSNKISDLNSRITNPSYPNADSKQRSYRYYIEIQKSMCGLRFTYENITLFKMSAAMVPSTCSMDSVTILTPNYPTQPICGYLTSNQVNVPGEAEQTVEVLITTQSKSHYWSVLVEQIPCVNVATKPLERTNGKCGIRPSRHGHSNEPSELVHNKNRDEDEDDVAKELDSMDVNYISHMSTCPIENNSNMRCYLDNIMHSNNNSKNNGMEDSMHNRIINGQQARRYSWPWQIVFLVKGRLLCGGALISENVAITAGHCLAVTQKNMNLSDLTVAAGMHKLGSANKKVQYRQCKRVVIHAQYADIHKDIALCFFDEPMTFSERIAPICLPYDTGKDFVGQDAIITGYGKTAANSGPADVLHEASIPIVSNSACQAAWIEVGGPQFSDLIENSMICGGGKNKSTCNGDSGGPLAIKGSSNHYTLIGLTSFGPSTKCNIPDKPLSVFTRISFHINFIALATAKTNTVNLTDDIKTYTPC